MLKKPKKVSKNDIQTIGQTLQILGVKINSTELVEVLDFVRKKIAKKEKFWIATPNPEFIVAAQKDSQFKKILNSADLAIPDGQGLILASKFLGTKPGLSERVAGSDLVCKLLEEASKENWRIGVVGARRGEVEEIRELMSRIRERYQGLEIEALEQTLDWSKQKFEIVFACQGMKLQEKWIFKNFKKTNASLFMGIGGALDFLSGFSKRAPFWIRNLGFEWFWRFLTKPSHLKRILIACFYFPYLVLKEKVRS